MFFSLWVVQCIGAGYKSNIYVENSVYATAATQKKPWDCKTSGSYKDYNITLKGCEGASDAQSKSGNNEYFVPSKYYTYKHCCPVKIVKYHLSSNSRNSFLDIQTLI